MSQNIKSSADTVLLKDLRMVIERGELPEIIVNNELDMGLLCVGESERLTALREDVAEGESPESIASRELDLALALIGANEPRNFWDMGIGSIIAMTVKREFQPGADELIETVVRQARAGDIESQRQCAYVLKALSQMQMVLPQPLSDLAADIMTGQLKPLPKIGRARATYRDRAIRTVIRRLLELYPDLKATRNPANHDEPEAAQSACSIVHSVLGQHGIQLSEKSVEAIYLKP